MWLTSLTALTLLLVVELDQVEHYHHHHHNHYVGEPGRWTEDDDGGSDDDEHQDNGDNEDGGDDKKAQAEGQKRPTISFISGAGSGEVVTDLGKSAELICQVVPDTKLYS